METADSAYARPSLNLDSGYGEDKGVSKVAKVLPRYDRQYLFAAKAILKASSDFLGISARFFWPVRLINVFCDMFISVFPVAGVQTWRQTTSRNKAI